MLVEISDLDNDKDIRFVHFSPDGDDAKGDGSAERPFRSRSLAIEDATYIAEKSWKRWQMQVGLEG